MRVPRSVIVFISFLVTLAAFDAFLIEPDWIEVTHHQLSAPLASPIKIAHLSDLHTYGLGKREQKMLSLLAEERPDIIVITGDSIYNGGFNSIFRGRAKLYQQTLEGKSARVFDPGTSDALRRRCVEVFRQLHAPLGVWLVDGNWEHWHPIQDELSYYKMAGVSFLKNSAAQVRPGIWMVGLDDAVTGSPDLNAALQGVPPEEFKIALFHAPAYFNKIAGRCDLALSGHTHGGQVWLPFLTSLWLPHGCKGFLAGWYEKGGSRMYVSRGLGTSVVNVRFLCRPELALITVGP